MNDSQDDGDALESCRKMSMKLYDDFAPIRAFIAEHPEKRADIIRAVVSEMKNIFLGDFYGNSKSGKSSSEEVGGE